MSEHLDLDALADALADEQEPSHLTGCADCAAAVTELRRASAAVTTALSGLPAPVLPADVASRLHESWPAAAGTSAPASSSAASSAASSASSSASSSAASPAVTTLPRSGPASRTSWRWLPAAAAVLVVLAGAGYGISRLAGPSGSGSATSAAGAKSAGAPAVNVVRNNTGADYTGRPSLAAAVPQLLAGTASRDTVAAAPSAPRSAAGANPLRAAADPLARLRDNGGLAECLLALLPPGDPTVRPLALDYASFKGQPAMVVLLPSSLPNKLDVFVVGPGCSRANDSTLFYTSVDKP